MAIHSNPIAISKEEFDKLPLYTVHHPTSPMAGFVYRYGRPMVNPTKFWKVTVVPAEKKGYVDYLINPINCVFKPKK